MLITKRGQTTQVRINLNPQPIKENEVITEMIIKQGTTLTQIGLVI